MNRMTEISGVASELNLAQTQIFEPTLMIALEETEPKHDKRGQ